jgi:DNA/RNA endonuclease YhcR with UshA esterase domain
MKKKTFLVAGLAVCLVILAAAFYWYQKPRSGLENIDPAYTLSATDLYESFQQNEKKANEQFVGKVIQVKGTVDNVQATDSSISVLLSSGNEIGGINCSMAKAKTKQKAIAAKGAVIQVKGRCVGFLMDVNLVDAIVER